jgi:hypothetical protein
MLCPKEQKLFLQEISFPKKNSRTETRNYIFSRAKALKCLRIKPTKLSLTQLKVK